MSTNRKTDKEVIVYVYTMRYYLFWKKKPDNVDGSKAVCCTD